jgi:hypothetical protein
MAKRGNEVKAPYAKPPEERYRSYRDEGSEQPTRGCEPGASKLASDFDQAFAADGHKLDS